MTPRIVVVGGGLAGLAAALRLAEAGEKPLLIETRKKLGGRATSFIDPGNSEEIDNCQHVLLGCCTNLIDFYDRLGVLELIEWHDTLYWSRGRGEIDVIRPNRLPAPFHLAGGINRLRFLDKSDRACIRRAMWRMIRMGPTGRQRWSGQRFGKFLEEQKQTPGAVERFWNVILVSALNLRAADADATYAIQVFQDGFLANRFGFTMGLPAVPLWRLYDPAVAAIESRGGDVLDGISAKSLAFDGRRITGVVSRDGVIRARVVVSALPYDRLLKVTSETLRTADARLQRLDQLRPSPILGVHLWYQQPVMDLPHLVGVDTGVHWLFNKGSDASGRQHIHAVISAADEWMALPEEAILDRVVADVELLLPASRGLRPMHTRTVKERRATFAPVAGVDAHRPGAAPGTIGLGGGGVPNLFLAGDWCATGWPATMESAVRSGYEAAYALSGQGGVVGDLPPQFWSRMLGLKPGGRVAS